jgi:hypothetical protein
MSLSKYNKLRHGLECWVTEAVDVLLKEEFTDQRVVDRIVAK